MLTLDKIYHAAFVPMPWERFSLTQNAPLRHL